MMKVPPRGVFSLLAQLHYCHRRCLQCRRCDDADANDFTIVPKIDDDADEKKSEDDSADDVPKWNDDSDDAAGADADEKKGEDDCNGEPHLAREQW